MNLFQQSSNNDYKPFLNLPTLTRELGANLGLDTLSLSHAPSKLANNGEMNTAAACIHARIGVAFPSSFGYPPAPCIDQGVHRLTTLSIELRADVTINYVRRCDRPWGWCATSEG